MTFGEQVRQWADLTDEQVARLEAHWQLLLTWNRRLNLTREAGEGGIRRHFGESLFLSSHLSGPHLLDLGSGAGFPGIPLAIARPEWQVTLLEADLKKAVFLKEATADLPNVGVLRIRSEELLARGTPTFDEVVSRAVRLSDVAALVPRIAPRALVLATLSQSDESWRLLAELPWDSTSGVLRFHVEQDG